MRRLLLAAMVVLPLGCACAMAACSTPTHVYTARKFDRQRQCLESFTAIDVIDGDDPGDKCALKCIVPPADIDAAAERRLYVSTMCPPYPPLFDTTNVFPGCNEALAAGERNDACLADGGSTHPAADAGGTSDAAALVDAAPEGDSGSDAADANAGDAGIEDAAADG